MSALVGSVSGVLAKPLPRAAMALAIVVALVIVALLATLPPNLAAA